MVERVVAIIDSFDEGGEQPANYVAQLEDGQFQGRVWDVVLERELILVTCETINEATGRVSAWSSQVRWLSDWYPSPREYVRPN
jgi:hypothetical protein